MHKSHLKEAKANKKSCNKNLYFKIMRYYPRLNDSIINHSWRGGSISLATESWASGVGARSGEGLEDEEGLEAMWTIKRDGPVWEGCGVGTIVGCGVGTPPVYGDWMCVLWAGPVCEGCGVDVDGVVAIVGCGVGTPARDGAWMGALCGIWLGTFMI